MKFNKLGGHGVVGSDRQCGKSLSLALGYISEALANPGKNVYVVDHYPTHAADRDLFNTIGSLIDQMGLKHITRVVSSMSIRFDLYEEREQPERIFQNGRFW